MGFFDIFRRNRGSSPLDARAGTTSGEEAPVNTTPRMPHGHQRPPARGPKLNEFIGVKGPASFEFNADGFPRYSMKATVTPNEYSLIRTTDATADPPDMLGKEVAKLRVRMIGVAADAQRPVAPFEPGGAGSDGPPDGNNDRDPNEGAPNTPPTPAPSPNDPEDPEAQDDDTEEGGEGGRTKQVEIRSEGADKFDNQSELAKWLQKIYDNAIDLKTFIQHSPWSMIYDVYFWQFRWGWCEGVGFVPDFRWGERLPKKAGGHLLLDPNHEDIVMEEYHDNVGNTYDALTLKSPRDWIVMKPGGSANPEGAGWLAIRFKRNAQRFQTADAQRELYAEQMSIPVRLVHWLASFLPVGDLTDKLDEVGETMTMAEAAGLLLLGDSNKSVADLLVYPKDGVEFLDGQETRLKARCMIAMMGTALLADTRASGPTGSSKEARTTANAAVVCWADYVAHLLNTYVTPAIIEMHESMFPGSVPKLKEGETMPRVQFVFPGQMAGDTNPTKDSSPDRVPENMRPMPEGNSKNEKGNEGNRRND